MEHVPFSSIFFDDSPGVKMVIFQFASLDQQRNELLAILGWYLLNVLFYVYIYITKCGEPHQGASIVALPVFCLRLS